jgi:hypothetical protein
VNAWEVTERVSGDDGSAPRRPAVATEEAHLDDLINEDSAVTAEMLEEQERARAAALATAPIRMAAASRDRLAAAAAGAVRTGARAAGATTHGFRLVAAHSAAGARSVANSAGRFHASYLASAPGRGSPRPVRRPLRRLGFAALAALAVAAPAAAAPAPWAALVGASVGGVGPAILSTGRPNTLLSPYAVGLLPGQLPARGLTGPGGADLDTTADPAAAGLPIGDSDRSIPSTVLLAYQKAADQIAAEDPGCHLPWSLLAGIGKVESNHARSWSGAERLTPAGAATPPILGPVLDGSRPGTARLLDTDGGRLDGNAAFDRAVGPMQFVPGTWKLLGRDGNGDGVADPNNVWDASLAAGTFLCEAGRDLASPAAEAAAVFAYNPSSDYVRTVLAWSRAYATGAEVDLGLPNDGVAVPPAVTGGDTPPGYTVPITEPTGGASPTGSLPSGASPTVPTTGLPTGPVRPTPTVSRPVPPSSTPPTVHQTPPPTTVTPAPFTLSLGPVTATRSGDHTTVVVNAPITATAAGDARLVLVLVGSDGYRVTGTVKQVHFDGGTAPVNVPIEIEGGFLGDAGLDGTYSATLSQQPTDAGGTPKPGSSPAALGGATAVGAGWKASEFPDYVPSVQRLRDRVAEFASTAYSSSDGKVISPSAAATLQADLAGTTPNLTTFRGHLVSLHQAGAVPDQAYARILSLLDRRQAPGATLPPEPTTKPAPPGWDPVLGAPPAS